MQVSCPWPVRTSGRRITDPGGQPIMRNRFLVVAGILGLMGGGAVAYTAGGARSADPPAAPTPPRGGRGGGVAAGGGPAEQSYPGVARARYETDLAFRVGPKIASRHVEVGQRVS